MESFKIIEQINYIKSKVDVNNLIYEGENIWPLLMRDFYFHQLRKGGTKKYSKYSKIKDLFKSIIKSSFSSQKINFKQAKKVNNLFLSYSTFKRGKLNNKWFDSYADATIINQKISSFYVIEVLQRGILRYPSYFNHSYFPHFLFIKAKIISKIKNYKSPFSKELKKVLILFKKFGYLKTEKHFINDYLEIYYYSKYFSKILVNSNIKNVYTTAYTMNFSTAIILAANKLGINTIEIQHGTIFKNNPIFTNWTIKSNLLPSFINVWSNAETSFLNNNYRLKGINTGNPFKKIFDNNEIILDHENSLWNNKNFQKSNTIVVCFARLDLPEFVFNFIKEYNSFKFIFRIHPGLNNTKFLMSQPYFSKALILPNVVYDSVSNLPLPYILKRVNYLIAWGSTTLIEAIDAKINPILISDTDIDYFKVNIEKKQIHVALSERDLNTIFNEQL